MALEEEKGSNKVFLNILADGSIRTQVSKFTPGALVRTFTLKEGTPQQETRTKYEWKFKSVPGVITKISITNGEYGEGLEVEFDGQYVVQTTISGYYAIEMIKKMASLDLAQPVRFKAYNFKDPKTGDRISGVNFFQGENGDITECDENKKFNYFFDPATKTGINGVPVAKEGDKDSRYWKTFFLEVEGFLVDFAKNQLAPMVAPFSGEIVPDPTLERLAKLAAIAEQKHNEEQARLRAIAGGKVDVTTTTVTTPATGGLESEEPKVPMGTETSTEDLVAKMESVKAPAEAPMTMDDLESQLEDKTANDLV